MDGDIAALLAMQQLTLKQLDAALLRFADAVCAVVAKHKLTDAAAIGCMRDYLHIFTNVDATELHWTVHVKDARGIEVQQVGVDRDGLFDVKAAVEELTATFPRFTFTCTWST